MKTSLRPTGGPRAGSLKFAVVLAIPYSWAVSTVRGLASSGGCCSEQLNSGTHRACVAVVEQVGKSLSRLRTTDRCRTRLGPNGFPTASRSGWYRDPRRHRHAGKEGDQFRVQPIHPMSKRPTGFSRVWLHALPRQAPTGCAGSQPAARGGGAVLVFGRRTVTVISSPCSHGARCGWPKD